MEMTGQHRLCVPRLVAWAALNDADLLRRATPGCDELVRVSDTEFHGKAEVRLGPVAARLGGKILLSEVDAPNGCTVGAEGSGAAGFAKGAARVTLSEDGDGTLLTYEVKAQVGGKLAQIGSRLLDGAARKLADEFFTRFAALLAEPDAS